jgi:hypothetical protein
MPPPPLSLPPEPQVSVTQILCQDAELDAARAQAARPQATNMRAQMESFDETRRAANRIGQDTYEYERR